MSESNDTAVETYEPVEQAEPVEAPVAESPEDEGINHLGGDDIGTNNGSEPAEAPVADPEAADTGEDDSSDDSAQAEYETAQLAIEPPIVEEFVPEAVEPAQPVEPTEPQAEPADAQPEPAAEKGADESQSYLDKAKSIGEDLDKAGVTHSPTENETPHPGNIPNNTEDENTGPALGRTLG